MLKNKNIFGLIIAVAVGTIIGLVGLVIINPRVLDIIIDQITVDKIISIINLSILLRVYNRQGTLDAKVDIYDKKVKNIVTDVNKEINRLEKRFSSHDTAMLVITEKQSILSGKVEIMEKIIFKNGNNN
jgi:hypothetical protein